MSKEWREQGVEDAKVQSMLEEMHANGFVQIPNDYLKVMTLQQAHFLCHLIFVRMVLFQKKLFRHKFKGWFFRKADKIEEEIGVNVRSQSRFIRELRKKKFLKTKSTGRFGQRLFWINFERLYREIEAAKREETSPNMEELYDN